MIIYSNAGLGNRLRVLFSYYYLYKNNKITMIWDKNKACTGLFLDYFKQLDNVNFIDNISEKIDIKTNSQHSHTKNIFIYKDLKLKDYLQEIINNNIKNLQKYIAIHIRRTDTISCPKKKNAYLSDEEYINFINKYPDYNIYIATDNYETQNKFYNLFKDRIKIINLIKQPSKYIPSIRQTSLEDTIIDIYMCVGATMFLGSSYSSLTTLIDDLRKNINI